MRVKTATNQFNSSVQHSQLTGRKAEKAIGISFPLVVTMSLLLRNDRWSPVGMLESGLSQREVATHFNVHTNTIGRMWNRFRATETIDDRPRSGRPRVTTPRQDRYIHVVHLQNRFLPATVTARNIPDLRPVSARTVRNRLREINLCPHRPAVRPVLEPHHTTY